MIHFSAASLFSAFFGTTQQSIQRVVPVSYTHLVDYELEQTSDFYNKIPVLKLNELLMENAKLAGAPRLAPPREKTGSTDFGNVMYEIPGSCIRVAFVPEGTSSHSQEFVDAGKTQAARDCILYGAKSIAGASMDLITKPELMDEVKAEFAENKKKFK